MLSCVTSSKLDSWKDTSESLMLNWKDQMSLHDSLVKTDRHLPDDLKNTLLENVVESNINLRAIKYQDYQTQNHQGRELICDQ